MIVNPGIRRFLGSAIQRLFNSASFYAPLTHSLVPERGTGSPTFTRASTATVTNNDGYLVTALAGEARFVGARRVRNLLPSTEGAFNAGAGWTLINGTVTSGVSDPLGGTSAYTLKQTGATSCELYPTTPFSGVVLSSLWIRRRSGTGEVRLYGGDAFTNITSQITSDWQRIPSNATTSSLVGFDLRLFTQNDEIDFWHPQAEDVTAQTTQTAGEYVSVGVESAPYYHGSMVDGVKCFPTDLSGNPIPAATMLGYSAEGARTNLCLQSNAFNTTWIDNGGVLTCTQNVVGPDGGTTAWTMTDDNASAIEGRAQAITLTAAAHTFSVFVKKTSGATTFPAISAFVGAVFAGATIDTNNGTATVWASFDALTPASGMSARCYSHNTNFWRAELTFTGTAASWTFIVCPAEASTGTQSAFTSAGAAAVTGSAVFYRAQVELGLFASSDIPTTTIAVARNADVLTYSSAGNIDGTKGWCYAEAGNTPNKASLRQPILATYPSGNGLILNNYTATDPASVEFYDGSAFRTGQTYTQSVAAQKFAASWGTGVRTAVGGSVTAQLTFDGDAAVGTVFAVGNYTDGTNGWFGTIRNVRIGQRQLSSSELQAVTR